MVYKNHQTFCPASQLISKLAEPLTDLTVSRAKQLFRFTFEVQSSLKTNEQQMALSKASRASVIFFSNVTKLLKDRNTKLMKDVVCQTMNMCDMGIR